MKITFLYKLLSQGNNLEFSGGEEMFGKNKKSSKSSRKNAEAGSDMSAKKNSSSSTKACGSSRSNSTTKNSK